MKKRFLTFYFTVGAEIFGKNRVIEQSLQCIEEEMEKKYKVSHIERGENKRFVLYAHDLKARARIAKELEKFHFVVEDIE